MPSKEEKGLRPPEDFRWADRWHWRRMLWRVRRMLRMEPTGYAIRACLLCFSVGSVIGRYLRE